MTEKQKVCLDHWITTNEWDEEDARSAAAQRHEFLEYLDFYYSSMYE